MLSGGVVGKVITRNQRYTLTVKTLYFVIGLVELEWIKIHTSLDVAGLALRSMATLVVCSAMFLFPITEKRWASLPTVARIRPGKDNKSSQSQKEDKRNKEYFST
jgi:hypothetical protein